MKMFAIYLSTALFTSFVFNAHALESGQKIKCLDNVSGYTYRIVINDIGDEEATVLVKRGNKTISFYPAEQVAFDESLAGATFELMNKQGKIQEVLFVDKSVENGVNGESYYYDNGDSRALTCFLK